MSAVALRLESFGARVPEETAPDGAQIERAYQDGYERGLLHGREVSLDDLTARLVQLGDTLDLHAAERSALRQDTLSEIGPVLSVLVDMLGRASAAERLRDALGREIQRLADDDARAVLRIRCPADMREDVEASVRRAGLLSTIIEDGDASTGAAEIISPQGRTTLDPSSVTAALGAIIDDIYRKD